MAEFTVDPSNSEFVMSRDGRLVAREFLGPGDVVIGEAPVASPVAPSAASTLAKLDQVPRPGAPPRLQTVSSTTQTTSGVPMGTLQPALDRMGASAEQQATSVEQAGDERARIGEEQAMARSTAAYGQHAQAQAEADLHAQRRAIAEKSALALSLQEDPEIDPDRFVDNMSTGQAIGTVILAALNGAFHGLTGRGGNDVISMLDARIEQDIQAQKSQIESGRIRRGNAVAHFRSLGLSEQEAESAARSNAWTQIDRMTEAEVARIGAGAARSDASLAAQQIRAQAAQRKEELMLSLGTSRSTTSTTRALPPAAAPMSAVDRAAEMRAERDIDSISRSGLTSSEYMQQSKEYSEKSRLNDDLVQRASAVVEALGGRVQAVRGQDGSVTGYQVVGEIDQPRSIGPLGSGDVEAYEQALAGLKRADVMGMAREPSANLQDEFARATDMPWSDENKRASLQRILDMAMRERTNLQSGYSPIVVRDADSRKSPVGIPESWR